MPSINKESVREQFDKFKTEFAALKKSGKVPSETRILIKGLLMLMEIILVAFLEKVTKKDNKNSSKPSSQTDKDDSALGQPGSKGKGKKENNQTANNTRTKKTVRRITVDTCDICGEDLSSVPSHQCERRTKIDIIFEKVVEHIELDVKECPACNSTVKAKAPKDMPGPLQYGDGIKAYIINLLVCQMVALKRVQNLVKSMMDCLIAEATMLKFISRLDQALADWESSAVTELLKAKAVNVDETSLRVDKKNHWIHTYSSGDITLKFLHRKRGTEAINDINIIPRYKGTIIHDCWASYLSYSGCRHGLCGSHLLRELTFIVDSNDYAWAKNMKKLLQRTCKAVSQGKNKKLSDDAYAKLQKCYRNILTRGEKELPIIPPKPKGKRGKVAKTDAHNLWKRLKEHESAVLLFAKNPYVSFTNNRAERDLRMAKVKQKISGCFRAELYAKAYCRISSYLQTMANKGYNPLIAIQIALAGKINDPLQ